MITPSNPNTRSMFSVAAFVTCLSAFALFTQVAAAQQTPTEQTASDQDNQGGSVQRTGVSYSLIVERNIFDRNRGRNQRGAGRNGQGPGGTDATTQNPRERTPSAPPDPGSDLVLTGVSLNDGRYLAFFENHRTGQVYAVASGETLAGRSVNEMDLDRVTLEQDGHPSFVVVGYTMLGLEAPRRATPPRPTTSRQNNNERNNRSNGGDTQQNNRRGFGGFGNGEGFGGFGGFGNNAQDENDNRGDGNRPIATPGGAEESNNDVLQRMLQRRQRERQER